MNVTLSKVPAPVVWAGDSAEKIVQIPLVALPAHAHQDSSYKVAPKQSARVTHFVPFLKFYFKIVFKVVQNDSTRWVTQGMLFEMLKHLGPVNLRKSALPVYAKCFIYDKWCLNKSVGQTENGLERGFVKHGRGFK